MKKFRVAGPEGVWHKFRKRKSSFVKGKKFLDIIRVYVFGERIIVEIENHELTPKREFMKELGIASFYFSVKEVDKAIKALKEAKKLAKRNERNL